MPKNKSPKAKTVKSVSVVLGSPDAKKSVVRYDADESDTAPAMRSGYVSNEAIKALGNPDKIRVTIEAA